MDVAAAVEADADDDEADDAEGMDEDVIYAMRCDAITRCELDAILDGAVVV